MDLTALDIVVLLSIGGAAVLGAIRGFVTEVLSLLAWLLVVLAVRLFHTPLAAMLLAPVGTTSGAAVLAFVLIVGIVWLGGKMVSNAIGRRTKASVLGPIDRGLGFGFGALKGLILVSLAFVVVVLVVDTWNGGAARRPQWIKSARTYPLLNNTSASIADFVDRRRRGEPVFNPETMKKIGR